MERERDTQPNCEYNTNNNIESTQFGQWSTSTLAFKTILSRLGLQETICLKQSFRAVSWSHESLTCPKLFSFGFNTVLWCIINVLPFTHCWWFIDKEDVAASTSYRSVIFTKIFDIKLCAIGSRCANICHCNSPEQVVCFLLSGWKIWASRIGHITLKQYRKVWALPWIARGQCRFGEPSREQRRRRLQHLYQTDIHFLSHRPIQSSRRDFRLRKNRCAVNRHHHSCPLIIM